MELKEYFGLDKHTLGNLKIRYIDFEKLECKSNVKRIYENDILVSIPDRNTGEVRTFSSITVSDDKIFNKLLLGAKKLGENESGNIVREYVILDVYVGGESKNNLKPLALKELELKYKEILSYIEDEYGICLTMKEAKYTSLEINRTFNVDRDIKEYQPFLELLPKLCPRRYRQGPNVQHNPDDGLIRFVSFDSGVMRIKIYDKRKQLKMRKVADLKDLYLRFEVCLNTDDKIKAVFGTNNINEITEEMLEEYFKKVLKEDIFDRFDEYMKVSNKALEKEKKRLKKEAPKSWTRDLFGRMDVPVKYDKKNFDMVYDIEQVKEVIKKDVKDNYSRTIKRCSSVMVGHEHKKNNLIIVDEIKEKLLNF